MLIPTPHLPTWEFQQFTLLNVKFFKNIFRMMPIHAPRLPTWELRQVRFLFNEENIHPSLTSLGCSLFSLTWGFIFPF
ncbi:hypothetical protein HanIR_Chr05g0226241 [Helianthus annuus]|nr:hypothetical protein HanIR_Chr05g0226241 [Helianthus annuus]